MDRRQFIGNSIKACAATAFAGGVSQKAFANSQLLQAIAGSCTDNILVLVQLSGGNDGLNTIIPLDQYSLLSSARSNILIPENKVLGTTKYNGTGFHPSTTGMWELFESNKFSIVQGCSYNNPDLSHFRATDILMSGSDSNEFLKTGWLGRNLDQIHPDFPEGYPSEVNTDPVAVQMGSTTALALEGELSSFGLAVTSISRDYALLSGFGDPAPDSRAGCELEYIRKVAVDTDSYNARILEAAANQPKNLSTKYGSGSLSSQLKNVARLIKGGLQTRVYVVSLFGFDHHANQTDSGDTTTGSHASLLKIVSEAVCAFQDDLELMEVNKRVTGLIFSEFGRRVTSNGSNGTDHGTAMPLMLFGSELIGDMYGTNPNLAASNGGVVSNVPMQRDYRDVYYSILKDWFCLSEAQLSNVFGGKHYEYIELFKPGSITGNSDDKHERERTNKLSSIYPQPMDTRTTIRFNTSGGLVLVEVFDLLGIKVATVLNTKVSPGVHEVGFEKNNLKSGTYYVKMTTDNFIETKKLVVK